jgi:hypothetical protein
MAEAGTKLRLPLRSEIEMMALGVGFTQEKILISIGETFKPE